MMLNVQSETEDKCGLGVLGLLYLPVSFTISATQGKTAHKQSSSCTLLNVCDYNMYLHNVCQIAVKAEM